MTPQKLRDIADENGWDFRPDYSGRGMFGAKCCAIVSDEPENVIAMVGIRGARMDSMGLRTIVYYTGIIEENHGNRN